MLISRRALLSTGSMAAIGFGVGACGPKTTPSLAPTRPPLSLPPVKIHCSVLAEDAIRAAIADWKKKRAQAEAKPAAAASATIEQRAE